MVQDYPILRIREKNKKLDCELSDPTSMQVTEIEEIFPSKTKNEILKHYDNIIETMAQPDYYDYLSYFKQELNVLSKKIGKILNSILTRFSIEVSKRGSLALALDEETVGIPWELGRISKLAGMKHSMMFCEAFCVGRLRIVPGEYWWSSSKKSRRKKALVVGINYTCRPKIGELTYAEDEAKQIATTLECNDIPVRLLIGEKATYDAVVEELVNGVDIFHFTGHGGLGWNKGRIYLNDKDLWAADIKKNFGGNPAPSFSFFNACESSVEAPKNGKVTWKPYSMPFAMASQGGNACVGTFWSVIEPDAKTFANTFYRKFLGYKKHKLGEAIKLARESIKKDASDSIFSWPAFVLYGPPTLDRDNMLTKEKTN